MNDSNEENTMLFGVFLVIMAFIIFLSVVGSYYKHTERKTECAQPTEVTK